MKKYLSDGQAAEKKVLAMARNNGGLARQVTDEMIQGMLTAVANGLTPAEASMAMGLNKRWIGDQMKKDEEFEAEVLKAMQSFKLYHINNIARHSNRSWQASAWLLERSFPERFNSRVAQEIASRAKPKEAPKWFGKDIEDAEVVTDESDGKSKGDIQEDASTSEPEAEDDKAT